MFRSAHARATGLLTICTARAFQVLSFGDAGLRAAACSADAAPNRRDRLIAVCNRAGELGLWLPDGPS